MVSRIVQMMQDKEQAPEIVTKEFFSEFERAYSIYEQAHNRISANFPNSPKWIQNKINLILDGDEKINLIEYAIDAQLIKVRDVETEEFRALAADRVKQAVEMWERRLVDIFLGKILAQNDNLCKIQTARVSGIRDTDKIQNPGSSLVNNVPNSEPAQDPKPDTPKKPIQEGLWT